MTILNSHRIMRKRNSDGGESPRPLPKAAGLAAFGRDIL